MKYGLVVFNGTSNIGDDFQSYAVEQFLPRVDYIIDREHIDTFYTESGEKVATIFAGWYLHNHLNWPPSPFIQGLPVSMHFDTCMWKVAGENLTRNFVLEDYGRKWLIENGPIGCRDEFTHKLLESYGIPSYFSGCITLTIKPFKNVENHGKICLVDVSDDIFNYVKTNTTKYVSTCSQMVNVSDFSWNERKKMTEKRLRYYQGASLIITTRLHVALPCLALGTPVILIKEEKSTDRIGTWLDYVHYVTEEDFLQGHHDFDFDNPKENPKEYVKIAEEIEEVCIRYISKVEKEEIENLDVKMFIEGINRIERIKKLMLLRINKYERELHDKK